MTKYLNGEFPTKPEGTGLKSSSSRFMNISNQETLERLPLLKSVPASERENLFLKKLKQASVVFDFSKIINLQEAEQKEIKKETLLELVDFLLTEKMKFTPPVYKAVFDMISINLFRPLPPRLNPTGEGFDPEDDEPILEAAWPHVQIVYDFFLKFVESSEFDCNIAKQFLTRSFLIQMLDLFDSEDPRERDYLKTTLHRIYGKFLSLRSFLRRQIKYIFLSFVYESDCHNGIPELLEILGSIINGFTLPLKPEHKEFLEKALIPLHKPKSMSIYHPQLSYCISQYLDKDPTLTEMVFKKILAYWPVTNSTRQLLFLSEIEDILCAVEPEQFVIIQELLFKKIAESISSTHFQIAEKALSLWNNEYILSLVADNVEVILPIVFPALYFDAKSHWNKAIRSMAYTSIRLFMDINELVFGKVIDDYRKQREKEVSARNERIGTWMKLFEEVDPQKLKEGPTPLEAPSGTKDPLLTNNDGLPLSVKIPHHMNQLVHDDFDPNDPVFKELTQLHQIQMNKKLRQKEALPIERRALDALQSHQALDDDEDQDDYQDYGHDQDNDSGEGEDWENPDDEIYDDGGEGSEDGSYESHSEEYSNESDED
eukprot:TRINITY_DN1334_c0_g1_i1.p1 TRINITY_DN1334_c0_g1~~TRINITY_DN1334_c0_g1_i1.p1  ORF type:complete len:670 (+),score=115.91 TRINITY_DN1334_c0_g1_i1:212-2011(+)